MNASPAITWRFAYLGRLEVSSAEAAAAWLSPADRDALAMLGDPVRRAGSLAARMLAKQLILERENLAPSDAPAIEVVSRDASGRGTRPQVSVDGRVRPWCLSLSHTDLAALAALCTTEGTSIGVDLVKIEPLGPGFQRAWFDAEERRLAAGDDPLETCRIWATKEAVYKAAGSGDPFSPRQIQVRGAPGGAFTCVYRGVDLADRCRVDTWAYPDHVAALAVVTRAAAQAGASHVQSSIPNP